MHIRISLSIKFQFKLSLLTLFFLDQICPKRIILVENRKRQYHHWIVYIRIGLHTKFQLRLTILIFGAKFAQKECFRFKTENVLHMKLCCTGPVRHNSIFNKRWQKHLRRLLMRVKVHRCVRCVLKLGKVRRCAGA